MAGVGDLLLPAAAANEPAEIVGVEIDEPVANQCAQRLPRARIYNEDAFCSTHLLKMDGWDLVITNPPYVRYQLQNNEESVMPSGRTTRSNLCTQISRFTHLTSSDRALFTKIAQNYSGLSDMAVPAWLLCAAMVKINGVLAIVVPETWLNREYAAPIQYMLLKCFDNITIVKDVSAAWFDNALVRTCLIVAERKKTVNFIEASHKKVFHLNLKAELISNNSLIAGLNYKNVNGYAALYELLKNREAVLGTGFEANYSEAITFFPNLTPAVRNAKWSTLEDHGISEDTVILPAELQQIIGKNYLPNYVSLKDIGITCGQGLRTGANDFFYLNIVSEDPINYTVHSKSWCTSPQSFIISKEYLIRVVTNRSTVDGLVISLDKLKTGVLYTTDAICASDVYICSPSVIKKYKLLPNPVSEYISSAEKYRNKRGLRFKDNSAVAPNEKKNDSGYLRFWYMLPPLKERHIPNLCITRIHSSCVECIFVPQSDTASVVVDANFSTLWGSSEKNIKIAMAILNSSWSKCYLELISTVMGGGALKVEASHIKKLLFPPLSQTQMDMLADCASKIIQAGHMTAALQDQIDYIVLSPFENTQQIVENIRQLLRKKIAERNDNS